MDLIAPNKDGLDIILMSIQILTLIALIIYVKKTWDMAVSTEKSAKTSEKTLQEMKETRDQEIAPYIVSYFEFKDHDLYLVVENVGKGLAKDVKFEFNPELQTDYDISNTPLIRDGLPSMPPKYKVKTFFNDIPTYLNSELPLKYDVKITYNGGLNEEIRSMEYTLDLGFIEKIEFIDENKMHNLVNEIKEMRKTHEKILQKLED